MIREEELQLLVKEKGIVKELKGYTLLRDPNIVELLFEEEDTDDPPVMGGAWCYFINENKLGTLTLEELLGLYYNYPPNYDVLFNSEKMHTNGFVRYGIDSGEGMLDFLEFSGIVVEGASGLHGSDNVIKLPDKTTFNWKSKDGIVRVNCKEKAMNVIEEKTGLKHIDNGPGDPTRPYSYIISAVSDLIDVVYALKTIEGNK